MTDEIIETDVLVLGGGLAGCLAAIKAQEAGQRVLLVDKGHLGRSGFSFQLSGALACFDPAKDNEEDWFRECLEAGDWLNDQERLTGMIAESAAVLDQFARWGVEFQKERGEYIRRPGVGHHFARNALLTKGGFQLMSVLRGEVLRSGARVLERVMITDLLTSDGELPTGGRVTGAAGFNIRNGKFYVIKAASVVIATGSTSLLWWTSSMPAMSGDGQAMAFRAGCEMSNYELCTIRFFPAGFTCAPGANALFGEGTIITNARGERFMAHHDPVRLERAPASVVSRAMTVEEVQGRGPVFWDATGLEEAAYARIKRAIPIVIRNFELAGLDIRRDRIKYTCGIRDLGAGGIRVDRENAATIPGLYSAGDASDHSEEGVDSVISRGMEAAVMGQRAGVAAARYAAANRLLPVVEKQIEKIRSNIFSALNREAGVTFAEVKVQCDEIHRQNLLGFSRNEAGLRQAAGMAARIREELIPRLRAKDYHELSRCLGIGNALLFPELVSAAALVRTESRGSHFREDYPEKDDENWRKWIVSRQEGSGIKSRTERIPFEKYPLKPEKPKPPG